MPEPKQPDRLVVRPFDFVRFIERLGAGRTPPELGDATLNAMASAMMADPRVGVEFKTYAGARYNGRDEEAPDGVLGSLLADLEIAHAISQTKRSEAYETFSTAIAGSAFLVLAKTAARIGKGHGLEDVCPPGDAGLAEAWLAPVDFHHDHYEKGRAIALAWLDSLLPNRKPPSGEAERARDRAAAVAVIERADVIRILPQHLLFIISQFGNCSYLLHGEPYPPDAMYEVGLAIRRHPDRPLMFVAEHCMVCSVCAGYDRGGYGLCNVQPRSLLRPDRNRNCNRISLRLLRTLGMEFYQPKPAVDVIRAALARVRPDHTSFTYKGSPPSVLGYVRSRYAGMGFLDAYDNPGDVVDRVGALLARLPVQTLLPHPDRAHMDSVLAAARQALARGDKQGAYQALIDEPFALTWKFYLEKIERAYARLPADWPRARRDPGGLPQAESRTVTAPQAEDGALAGPAWREGAWNAGFRTTAERPAIAETAFRVVHDARALYVGCAGADHDPAAIKADYRTGPDVRIAKRLKRMQPGVLWNTVDDCFSICIQPEEGSESFFLFTFNAKGVKIAERRTEFEPAYLLLDSEWQVKARIGPGGWTALVEIPFECLGVSGPPRGAWRFNVYRFIRNEELDPHAWTSASMKDLFRPALFGSLSFGACKQPEARRGGGQR